MTTQAWLSGAPASLVRLDGASWIREGVHGPWVRVWLESAIDWGSFRPCTPHETAVLERELSDFCEGDWDDDESPYDDNGNLIRGDFDDDDDEM